MGADTKRIIDCGLGKRAEPIAHTANVLFVEFLGLLRKSECSYIKNAALHASFTVSQLPDSNQWGTIYYILYIILIK
jgi:hypothetical protein